MNMGRYAKKSGDISYDALIMEVIDEVCEKHKAPIAADYERAVAELICSQKDNPDYITPRQIHTAIRNHIMNLAKNDDIYSDGKHYWTHEAYSKYTGEKAFIENVVPSKKVAAMISLTAIAIAVEPNTDKQSAKEAILDFVGFPNVYSIFLCEDTIVIVFENLMKDGFFNEINELLEKAYIYHHRD